MKYFVCIVGAQRSGTTYLYQLLDEHPEVCMAKPVRPEPKFFLNPDEYTQGKDHYLRKYFAHCDELVKVVGEKGTSYIENPEVAMRIKSIFPDAKILLILRNPVTRAISNFCFSRENGLETRGLYDVFINHVQPPAVNMRVSVSPFDYLPRGDYAKYLTPYANAFKSSLKILILEEFAAGLSAIGDVYGFLKVDRTFVPPSVTQPYNTSDLGKLNPDELRIVSRHLHDYYAPRVAQLEKLLNRRIDAWHDKI